jgi:D-aspartate ligase
MDTSVPVVVLSSARHGGLGLARSLGRWGVPVYIVDADPRTPSFSSRYCREKFVWNIDRAPTGDSLEFLWATGHKLKRRAILIPTSDVAALFLAANSDALRPLFLFPRLSYRFAHSFINKKEMYGLAQGAGVATPNTVFPQSMDDVRNFAETARFPIIVKTIDGRRGRPRSGYPIAQGKRELLDQYQNIAHCDHGNLMLQEFIPGGENANWMFNGYFDQNSECLFGATGRKLRQHPPYAGITSLGVCEPNPIVDETTRRFMNTTGYRGILDIGYRYDARDGQYKVFDINPRIGCTFRLFVSDTGMDVARAMYLNMTGQAVDGGRVVPGRKWIVEDLDFASAFRYWRDGKLTANTWMRSFRGLHEFAFFASDDPLPMIRMGRNGLRELLRIRWTLSPAARLHSRETEN